MVTDDFHEFEIKEKESNLIRRKIERYPRWGYK
jgi:hypothetical protein